MDKTTERIAVLVSGGVDSAVLAAELCREYSAVFPLFVQSGFIWETTELSYLQRFVESIDRPQLKRIKTLDVPIRDVYGDHWSTTGQNVPDENSPDAAVYLPGRNVFLISKAAIWCSLNQIELLALGSLKGNPFGDSTPEFDQTISHLMHQAVGMRLRILRPLISYSKQQVLQLGRHLPLEHTFSCIHPIQGAHCGRCNKCAERRRAFELAGMEDRTIYQSTPSN